MVEYTYDVMDRVTNISWKTASGASLGGFAYGYDAVGRIQGAVWGYVDSQNNVVARWTYDAWGNVISEYVAPSAAALTMLRYRFQGREWSAVTGLTNFRMRWYDAETGRWLSKDPIGLSGGLNLYAFCGGDAVNYGDLYGAHPDDYACVQTGQSECLNGDKIIADITKFYDGIDAAAREKWWVCKGFTSYIALFSLSGGPWGPCDFKARVKNRICVYYNGEYFNADEFGNFAAGYQAGYSGVRGLLIGVRIGGLIWSMPPGDEAIGDADSLPMIYRGFNEGVKKRLQNGASGKR